MRHVHGSGQWTRSWCAAQTKVVQNQLSPDWGERFEFFISSTSLYVSFNVKDHDTVGKSTLLVRARALSDGRACR